MTQSRLQRIYTISCVILAGLAASGCQKKPAAAAPGAGGPQALPVQTVTVTMAPVAQSSEYVATIKSRRSTELLPQVSGQLINIRVHSGDHVKAGEPLMEIDAQQQRATVNSLRATELQKKALNDYDTIEEDRQRKLFDAGVTSRDAYEQAQQAFQNAKADYQSAVEARKAGEQELSYYSIRAPFDGVVGDIPVHVGDFVSQNQSPATILTTVDDNNNLEAYIYIPTERATEVHQGLAVDLTDDSGKLLQKTRIDFVSSEVDSTLQGILAKAPVQTGPEGLRNAQIVKARVIWSTKPMAVVPVLAVTRQGEESFVYVVVKQNGMAAAHRTSVVLGDTVGNSYSIISGLNTGDSVIISGTQFLVDGMPVMPLPPQAAPPQGPAASGPQSKLEGAQPANSAAPRNETRNAPGNKSRNAAGAASGNESNKVSRKVAYHPRHRRHRRARARKNHHTPPATVS
ncbi:MAG: efflux RND transporter periplasmic adaptor subunit [Terracidiphilus sp.]